MQIFANTRQYRQLFIWFFLLNCGSVYASAQQQYATDLIHQMQQSYFHHHPPVTANDQQIQQALDDLYFFSPGAFVWLGHPETLNLVEQALLNLEHAEQSGLHPDDYGSTALRNAWNQLLCHQHDGLADYARFDFSLSLGILRFLSDLRFGRIEPMAIRFDLDQPRNLDSLVALILSVTGQNQVNKLTGLAEPQYPPYRQLKQALKHYRALDHQVWPYLAFSQTLEPGDRHPQIADLTKILVMLGFMPEQKNNLPPPEHTIATVIPETGVFSESLQDGNLYAGAVVEAVKQFQRQHGLAADGVIGRQTLAALNTPIRQRITQLELAMEHWRWLPPLNPEQSLILGNIPAFHLWVYPNSDLSQPATLDMKVIVGMAKENQTPVFTKRLQYLEFGPYWNIPRKIAVKEILPKIQQDPEYLAKHNMELVADFHTDTEILPVTESFADDLVNGRVHIRQRPGPGNALGQIKFIFPNQHAVYLHDTPSHRLFYKSRRDLSHGCVRVEQPRKLAEYILANANNWRKKEVLDALRKKKNRRVRVKQRFQVLLFYNTADVMDGKVFFYRDIYRLDSQLAEQLKQYSQYAAQTFNRQITAFLSPVTNIPGIKMNKTARIIANATTP
jgi:murein L,D-transpeptidase YcbB/YkuD